MREDALTLLEDRAELVRRSPVGADVHRSDAVLGNSKVHELVDAFSDTPCILLSDHEGVTKRCCLRVGVFRESFEEVDHVVLCDLLADGLVRRQLLFHQLAPLGRGKPDVRTNVSMLSGSKPSQPIFWARSTRCLWRSRTVASVTSTYFS